jgi:hypothetical protein
MDCKSPRFALFVVFGLALTGAWMLAAPGAQGHANGLLSDAQMRATWGSQSAEGDCDHVDDNNACNQTDTCTGCKSAASGARDPVCNNYTDIGTGNIQHVCGVWEAPTIFCSLDGTVVCQKRYLCDHSTPVLNTKCGPNGICVQQAGQTCVQCSRGAFVQDLTPVPNYKCES